MKTIIFILIIIFPLVIYAQEATVNIQDFESLNKSVDVLKGEINKLKQNTNNVALEKTIDILTTTNNALTQKWTPLNTILAAISALLSLITIISAGVFALGIFAWRRFKRNEVNMKKLFEESKKGFNSIFEQGNKMLEQLGDKKKSVSTREKDWNEFKEKANKTLERLEDKTFSISGINSTLRIDSNSLGELKICSKCGMVFSDSLGYSFDLLTQRAPAYSLMRPLGDIFYDSKKLCQKCREEEKNK